MADIDTQTEPRETTRTAMVVNSPAYLCGRPLGEILVHTAKLPREKLDEALAQQSEKGGRLGEVLVGMKAVTEVDVLRALSIQLDLPFSEEIDPAEADEEKLKKIPIQFARQGRVLPLGTEGDAAVVAVADPLDTSLLDRVRVLLDQPVLARVAPGQVIVDAINQAYDRAADEAQALVEDLEGDNLDALAHELEEPQDLLDASSDEAPIIKLVNSIMFRAVKERASDIHIEPMDRYMVVRFRLDGVLHEVIRPPKRYQKAIASRIKILGGLNIAETRLPQDGRIRIKIAGKDVDIRLSTVPTSHGERLVLRLLDKSAVLLDLKEIGFAPDQLDVMHGLIDKSHGIILVTGPTGSGKTTTLYAALSRINKPDLNILTVEDPIEYQLNGIGQVPVNAKIGLSFASGLRSFLRQDPDKIMVGEIRDLETAQIAVQASLTGHVVLATLHTNDAPGAVTRLIDMGLEPFLISASLEGILGQRLVRKICKTCRTAFEPDHEMIELLGADPLIIADKQFYFGKGCPECSQSGYRGRQGLFELMMITDNIRELITKKAPTLVLKQKAVEQGMRTLRDDGLRAIFDGLTTIEEVLKYT